MSRAAPRGSSQQRGALAARLACALPVVSLVWGGIVAGCGGEGASDARGLDGARQGAGGEGGSTARDKAVPQACASDADCVDGCSLWFEDLDADGFGSNDLGAARGFCGSAPPVLGFPVALNADDCCDLNSLVSPAQTESFAARIEDACPLARGFDYDCDGVIRYRDDIGVTPWVGACDDTSNPSNDPNLPCVERSGVFVAEAELDAAEPFTFDGSATACGDPSTEWKSCRLVGETCVGQSLIAPPCN